MSLLQNAVVPHFFDKEPIPKITDCGLLSSIERIRHCTTVHQAMYVALEMLASKFQSKRLEAYVFFYKLFEKDPNTLWRREGFMHCTQQNYLFRVLLIKSGKLKEKDISLGYSLVYFVSPHQFLKVNIRGKEMAIDPWNYGRGAILGKYAAGIGVKSISNANH